MRPLGHDAGEADALFGSRTGDGRGDACAVATLELIDRLVDGQAPEVGRVVEADLPALDDDDAWSGGSAV